LWTDSVYVPSMALLLDVMSYQVLTGILGFV